MTGTAMAASQTTWVMTPELYPTRVRATAHSLLNCFARIGALISPFLVISDLNTIVIVIILGLVNVMATFSSWSLEETAGKGLDHFEDKDEDEDKIGNKEKFMITKEKMKTTDNPMIASSSSSSSAVKIELGNI